MARVGRVQSMISRWYCSAAFLTSCILGNRCSTSIRAPKTKLFQNVLLLFFFWKWIVFKWRKNDAQNSRRMTDRCVSNREREWSQTISWWKGELISPSIRRFLAMSLTSYSDSSSVQGTIWLFLTTSSQRKFVGVRNDAFKCWHTTQNTHRTTHAGALAQNQPKLFTLLITGSGCVHVGIASQDKSEGGGNCRGKYLLT